MKTILSRMKTLVQNNNNSGQVLSYVKSSEIIHPEVGLTFNSKAIFPRIVFTPISTIENWISSQEKESINLVNAHLLLFYIQRETSIMGDASRSGNQGTGILDFTNNFLSVFRGHRLAVNGNNYLNKPLDILGIDYMTQETDDNSFFLVSVIRMECRYVFFQTSLPGNI